MTKTTIPTKFNLAAFLSGLATVATAYATNKQLPSSAEITGIITGSGLAGTAIVAQVVHFLHLGQLGKIAPALDHDTVAFVHQLEQDFPAVASKVNSVEQLVSDTVTKTVAALPAAAQPTVEQIVQAVLTRLSSAATAPPA